MIGVTEMITPAQQRSVMRRIAPDNPVRRCLIMVDNIEEKARDDNFRNNFKEEFAREAKEKREKWNFDFEKEVALDGPYEWHKLVGDKFVRMEPQSENVEPADKVVKMQLDNERTPRTVRDNTVPILRKRRSDLASTVECQSFKKRLSYD